MCYFNSHAHVERDPNNYTDKIDLNISTHTLTWSVTTDIAFSFPPSIISTHTLTWSVTIAALLSFR